MPTEEEGTHWAKGGQHCRSTHCRNILKQETIIVHTPHVETIFNREMMIAMMNITVMKLGNMFGGRKKRRLRIRNKENENLVIASICDFSAQNVSSENTSNLKSTSKTEKATW